MGRVYNALLKADKLSSRNRPIGRPAQQDAETRGRGDAARPASGGFPETAVRQSADQATAQFSHFDGAATAPAFEHNDSFAHSQPFVERATAEPPAAPHTFIPTPPAMPTVAPPSAARSSVAPPARAFAASPRPRVSVSQFEEPREIANVKDLRIDAHLAAITGDDQLAAERYRTLAVRLVNFASRRKLKTLIVTSAVAGEGKTTVAVNLAWMMAKRAERRVLLVDANLRYSAVTRMLGTAPTFGWLDFASGKSKLSDAITRVDPNGLYLTTPRTMASSNESNDADVLASPNIEKLIAQIERQFDLIVIDAPALMESADAQQLAAIADGAVIVARAGHTPHDRVADAIKLVPEDRRLGVVLNESEIDAETAYQDQSKGRLFGRRNRRGRRQ